MPRKSTAPLTERTLYLPKCRWARCLAAAFRHLAAKLKSCDLPECGLEFGKKHTSGKECFPCIRYDWRHVRFHDRHIAQGANVNDSLAFFMPETRAPAGLGSIPDCIAFYSTNISMLTCRFCRRVLKGQLPFQRLL
jgi:hypothetical protein